MLVIFWVFLFTYSYVYLLLVILTLAYLAITESKLKFNGSTATKSEGHFTLYQTHRSTFSPNIKQQCLLKLGYVKSYAVQWYTCIKVIYLHQKIVSSFYSALPTDVKSRPSISFNNFDLFIDLTLAIFSQN